VTVSRRRKPKKKPRRAAKKKRGGRPHTILMHVHPRVTRARRAAATEALGIRCRVLDVVPEAEALILGEQVSGLQFTIPVPSRAKDGRLARDLVPLKGQDIWLSLRVM